MAYTNKGFTPQLSIVVCTYNREIYILKNLNSFLKQTIPFEYFELVIVNNNSPDNTDYISTNFIKENPNLNIKYVIETNQGLTHARNRGIKESSAPIISFIDDDAFIRPDYCKETINFFKNHPEVTVAGGKIIPLYESGQEPKWMTPYLLTLMAAQDLGNQVKPFDTRKFPIGANMIFQKSIFNKVGLFNPDLGRKGDNLEGGEEKDIVFKIRAVGGKVYYSPHIIVDHIISEIREEMTYIKKMGVGIGISEITRVKQKGFAGVLGKIAEELFKWGATGILFFWYIVKLTPVKGWTLVKFRFWVLTGLFRGKS